MSKTRQHQPLRVPNGWTEQDRALVIQLEKLFDELYALTSRLEDISVTDVAYDTTTKKLTLTIDGKTSDITKIAVLDGNDKIPAALLPSYVDDVEEYDTLSDFPATGEADKIYVAKDTGFTYRWSGTQYVRLNTYDEATQSSSGLMSATDKTKLDGIEEHANNYNLPLADSAARGGIRVGYTESGQKYAVQLSSEQAYVEVPWQDTKNSAGTMNRVNKKLYLVGAETQATNPTTNSNANVYIGTDNCLYSNGTKVLTGHQDISGKADKVSGATNGNFAALDSSGNLTDSGHKHGDYLTQHQDISGKADLYGYPEFQEIRINHYSDPNHNQIIRIYEGNGPDSGVTAGAIMFNTDIRRFVFRSKGSLNGQNIDFRLPLPTDPLSDESYEIYTSLGSFTWGQLAGQ